MADRLEFDIALNGDEAQSLIRTLAENLTEAGKAFTDALDFSSATAQAQELSSALDVSAATAFADAMATAQAALNDMSLPQGAGLADDMQAVSEATAAALGNFVDMNLTEEQAAEVAAIIAEEVGNVAASAEGAVGALSGVGDSMTGIAAASTETGERIKESASNQDQLNSSTGSGVTLAGKLAEEFQKAQGSVEGLLGPLSRFKDRIGDVIKDLPGITKVAGSGLLAGITVTMSAGEQWRNIMTEVKRESGATGEELDQLGDSFGNILSKSGRPAAELANIMANLHRDLGLAGPDLEKLTVTTASFLKTVGGTDNDMRVLNQTMKVFGVSTGEAARFEKELEVASLRFGTNIGSLLQQVKTAGPALQTLGMDRAAIVGTIGQLDQAGLRVQSLIPGLNNLAKQAGQKGISGAEAFGDLNQRIKDAVSNQAALNEVSGIFSGRVAAQYVNAVRTGNIDLAKMSAIMGEVREKTTTLNLGTAFGQIRNDLLRTLGPLGEDLIQPLAQAVTDAQPVFEQLFKVIRDLAPAFRTAVEVGIAPFALALKALGPVLSLLDTVLTHLPGPILQVVGAMVAWKLTVAAGMITPLGNLVDRVTSLHKAFQPLPAGMEGPTLAGQKLTTVLTGGKGIKGGLAGAFGEVAAAIDPLTLIVGTGVGLYSLLSQEFKDNASRAKEFADGVDGLNKSLGDLSVTSEKGKAVLATVLDKGTVSKIINDNDLAVFKNAGLAINDVAQNAIDLYNNPQVDIGKRITQSLIESRGPLAAFITLHDRIADKDRPGLLAEAAADPDALIEKWRQSGGSMAQQFEAFKNGTLNLTKFVVDAEGHVVQAIRDAGQARLDEFKKATDDGGALIAEAEASLGLADAKGHEWEVLQKATRIKNDHFLATHNMTAATDEEAASMAAFVDELEKAHLLDEQVAADKVRNRDLTLAVADATKDGVLSAQEMEDINRRGLGDLHQIQAAQQSQAFFMGKTAAQTKTLGDANTIYFEALSRGVSRQDAMRTAVDLTGVSVDELAGSVKGLEGDFKFLNRSVDDTSVGMSTLIRDLHDGANADRIRADVLASVNGDQAKANKILADYGVTADKTAGALNSLVPSMNDINTQLNKVGEGGGPAKFFDDQTKSIQGNTAAQVQWFDTMIGNAQAARDLAKERDPNFDTTAFDARIADLQAQKDKALAVGTDAEKAAKDAQARILAEPPAGIDQILDTMAVVVDTKIRNSDTVKRLKDSGAGDLMKAIFDPSSGLDKATKERLLQEAATASPQELQAMEQRAKTLVARQGESAKQNAELGDLFAEVNPEFVRNSEAQGRANGEALAKGTSAAIIEADLPGFMQSVLASGIDPTALKKKFPKLFPDDSPKPRTPDEQAANLNSLGAAEAARDIPAPKILINGLDPDDARKAFDASFFGHPASEADAAFLGINIPPAMSTAGLDSAESFSQSFRDQVAARFRENPLSTTELDALMASVAAWANGAGVSIGTAIDAGVAEGIRKGQAATQAAFDMAHNVNGEVVTTLGITSPSKVFMRHGEHLMEGLAIGIEGYGHKATGAAAKISEALRATIGGTVGSASTMTTVEGTVALDDGPGVQKIVAAIKGQAPGGRVRRRLPFGGRP